MTLQEKHMKELNRLAFLVSGILSTFLIIATFISAYNNKLTAGYVTGVIAILLFAANAVSYKKFQFEETYKHCVSILTFFIYVMALFAFNDVYIYAFIFPVAMMIMVYQDYQLILRSGIIAAVADLIYFIIFTNTHSGKLTADAFVIQMCTIVIAATTSYFISKRHEIQVKETTNEIESQAKGQNETSGLIVQHARSLAEKFNLAMDVSNELSATITSSHNAVDEIAENSRVTAEAISHQTQQTYEIQGHIEDVEKETRQMTSISKTTMTVVDEGVELVEKLKAQSAEVAIISHETEQTTRELNESIRQVERITDTIIGISEQTNLLALNASIEAARAGEAGKGFAVVAEEIRNLSESTKNATEEISLIISKLISDAEEASLKMSKSADYAEQQNDMIDVTGAKLFDIKNNADILYKSIQNVNSSFNNILTANTAISDSISNISATSEQVAAATDNTLDLCNQSLDSMNNMNGLLSDIHGISEEMLKIASN